MVCEVHWMNFCYLLYCCCCRFGGESVKIIISYSNRLLSWTWRAMSKLWQPISALFKNCQGFSRRRTDWERSRAYKKDANFCVVFVQLYTNRYLCWCWKELLSKAAFYVCIIHCFWMEQLANILSKSAIKGRPKSKGFLKKRNQVEQIWLPWNDAGRRRNLRICTTIFPVLADFAMVVQVCLISQY